MAWLPLITAVFRLYSVFGDDSGQAPAWLVALSGAIFRGMWTSYDGVFIKLFGDGERTLYEDEDDNDADVRVCFPTYDSVCEKGRNRFGEV